MFDALQQYAYRDELSHLRFDFNFDDVFIEFMNHNNYLDFEIDV